MNALAALRQAISLILTLLRQRPGSELWRAYEGQEYIVFIDESFFKFFDFTHQDGNFVHGAVGLPLGRYSDFKQLLAPAVEEYATAVHESQGVRPKELKSADLYKLMFGPRRQFIHKLSAALESNGGFIAGFYTSNRGYVMEKIREDLIGQDGLLAVPEDHRDLYDRRVQLLNESARGPGMSHLISELLSLPVMAMSYFLNSLNCSFRVVYDPRQDAEDLAVKATIEGLIGALHSAEKLGLRSKFLGMEIEKASHEEFGLQVADLVAGEVRRLFRFNPELLTAGSDLNLITFEHQDGETPLLDEVAGRPMKKGRQVAIPDSVLQRAIQPTEDCAFAELSHLLAAGLVTCVTEFGTERDVSLYRGLFLDLCD